MEAGVVHESRSVLSRPAPPPDLTLRYGDHPDQVIDVRRPAGPGPLVIFLHYWGRGPAEKLATSFKAALDELGKSGASNAMAH